MLSVPAIVAASLLGTVVGPSYWTAGYGFTTLHGEGWCTDVGVPCRVCFGESLRPGYSDVTLLLSHYTLVPGYLMKTAIGVRVEKVSWDRTTGEFEWCILADAATVDHATKERYPGSIRVSVDAVAFSTNFDEWSYRGSTTSVSTYDNSAGKNRSTVFFGTPRTSAEISFPGTRPNLLVGLSGFLVTGQSEQSLRGEFFEIGINIAGSIKDDHTISLDSGVALACTNSGAGMEAALARIYGTALAGGSQLECQNVHYAGTANMDVATTETFPAGAPAAFFALSQFNFTRVSAPAQQSISVLEAGVTDVQPASGNMTLRVSYVQKDTSYPNCGPVTYDYTVGGVLCRVR